MNEETKEKPLRCFIAIEVPKEFYSGIYELQKEFDTVLLKTNVNSFHITLCFLGTISNLKEIISKLNEIKATCFDVFLSNLHYFAKGIHPTVLSIGVISSELAMLSKKISNCLNIIDDKTFVSHITLFRIKKVLDDKTFKDKVSSLQYIKRFKCTEFLLFSSTLTMAGPVYTVLERFNLM